MQRILIRVSGKVQGVFYRASAKEVADRLGIRGIVRNETDGSVYLEAEGNDPELAHFADWCRKGPLRAHVVTFVMEYAAPNGYVGFRIVR